MGPAKKTSCHNYVTMRTDRYSNINIVIRTSRDIQYGSLDDGDNGAINDKNENNKDTTTRITGHTEVIKVVTSYVTTRESWYRGDNERAGNEREQELGGNESNSYPIDLVSIQWYV